MSSYYEFKQIEKNGKLRRIGVPDDEAREFNDRLVKTMLSRSRNSLGERTGNPTIFENVRPHVDQKNEHFYILDLEDAYSHVMSTKLVTVALRNHLLYPTDDYLETLEKLKEYCIDPETGGLIQGAPASPGLFNLYCENLDTRFNDFSAGAGFTYTRYADDLTFSAKGSGERDPNPITQSKRRIIRQFIKSEGFDVSHPKSRVHSLTDKPVTITGLSIYPDFRVGLAPDLMQRASSAIDSVYRTMLRGATPSPTDIGRMHGYHGLFKELDKQTPDRKPKHAERLLRERYEILKAALGSPLGAAALVPEGSYVQPELFDRVGRQA